MNLIRNTKRRLNNKIQNNLIKIEKNEIRINEIKKLRIGEIGKYTYKK